MDARLAPPPFASLVCFQAVAPTLTTAGRGVFSGEPGYLPFGAKVPAPSQGRLAQVAARVLGRDRVRVWCFQKCLLMEERLGS